MIWEIIEPTSMQALIKPEMDPVHEYLLPPSATLEEKMLPQISKNCIFRSFALTFFPHWREVGAKEI